MAYISLYRKYRPQVFEDVVGQEHVTTTLQNAIREGRIASGYLFCGTRGTAKTTCARILAKALNCIGPDGSRTQPTSEPCGICGPCQAIAASSFVDVVEMDAASQGKVDNVRDIVSGIKFPPMQGRYKVYIIDEAHQLSRDAMDAFLKTLEEPPDRVVFVLATTEKEKLPITIASRCQVFEFKRGTVTQLAARLKYVLQAEGIKADPQAVTLIARAAEGSYRDSLSLLEQVLAYNRESVTTSDVTLVLGAIDEDVLTRLIGRIAESDAAGVFAQISGILESGKEVRPFLKSLAGRFRDMLFVAVGAQAGGEEIDDSAAVREQAARFSPAALLHALETLTEAESETRWNNQHRLLLELALLKLMDLPLTSTVTAPAPKYAPVIAEAPAPSVQAAREMPAPLLDMTLATESESDLEDEDDPIDMPLPGDDDLNMPPLEADTLAEEDTDDLLLLTPAASEPAPVAPPPPDPRTASDGIGPEELIRLQKSWQEVINRMESRSPSGLPLIKDARPVALTGRTLTLQFSSRFFVDKMEKSERGRRIVEEIIDKTLEAPSGTYKIKCALQDQPNVPAKVALGTAPQPARALSPASAEHSPLMDDVIAVFGGRILEDDAK